MEGWPEPPTAIADSCPAKIHTWFRDEARQRNDSIRNYFPFPIWQKHMKNGVSGLLSTDIYHGAFWTLYRSWSGHSSFHLFACNSTLSIRFPTIQCTDMVSHVLMSVELLFITHQRAYGSERVVICGTHITNFADSLKNLYISNNHVVNLIIAVTSVKYLLSLISCCNTCAHLHLFGTVSIHGPMNSCSPGAGFQHTVFICVCTLKFAITCKSQSTNPLNPETPLSL